MSLAKLTSRTGCRNTTWSCPSSSRICPTAGQSPSTSMSSYVNQMQNAQRVSEVAGMDAPAVRLAVRTEVARASTSRLRRAKRLRIAERCQLLDCWRRSEKCFTCSAFLRTCARSQPLEDRCADWWSYWWRSLCRSVRTRGLYDDSARCDRRCWRCCLGCVRRQVVRSGAGSSSGA